MDDELEQGSGDDAGAIVEATIFDELMGKSVDDILREGQKDLFARLVAKVRTNRASHQEMAIFRNILKDNGLTLGIPPQAAENSPKVDLPEFTDPEYLGDGP